MVVGGAGYIGSHVCKELAHRGYTPVCYDNLVYGHKWAVKWGPLEIGDIADGAKLREVMAKYKPRGVVHLAAFAYVGESVIDPGKYYVNNVGGTLSLLDAMRASDVSTIVFSSTCAVYGVPKQVPITERTVPNPVNPYGASKHMVERILQDYHNAYGLSFAALRYFNAAGGDPEGEIGESHDPETHLIPLMLDAALGRRDSLTVFGGDYPTPDGTCVRDYIHVTDLARAHVLALRALTDKKKDFLIVNLGTGTGHSVLDMIRVVEEISGVKVPYTVAPRREGDPPVLVADPAEALRQLSWKAEYPQLVQIVKHAWDFRQKTTAKI
ncbi:MAG TPA: UDP-glucose 4-epimerase GalE [Chitinivibrionales bacterium]